MKALDRQVGGSHYKSYKIQPVEFITENDLSYIEGCVIKYICRHRRKNGKDDLLKAIHYIELLIDQVYPEKSDCTELTQQFVEFHNAIAKVRSEHAIKVESPTQSHGDGGA